MPRAALPINRSRVSDSMWWRTSEPNRLRFCLPETELSAKLSQSTGWTPRLEMKNSKIMRSVVGGRKAGRENCCRICSLPDCSLSVLSPWSRCLPKKLKSFYRTLSLAKSDALQVAQTRKRIHSSAMLVNACKFPRGRCGLRVRVLAAPLLRADIPWSHLGDLKQQDSSWWQFHPVGLLHVGVKIEKQLHSLLMNFRIICICIPRT